MRFLLLAFILSVPFTAYADEFGSRFGDQVPAALAEEAAQDLQAIEPAAGDEGTTDVQSAGESTGDGAHIGLGQDVSSEDSQSSAETIDTGVYIGNDMVGITNNSEQGPVVILE